MLNLPNFLTLIRILTIPFFLVFLAYHRYWEALILFIFGGVTDFLDGLAARLMHQQTALGAYLDPVADKLASDFGRGLGVAPQSHNPPSLADKFSHWRNRHRYRCVRSSISLQRAHVAPE